MNPHRVCVCSCLQCLACHKARKRAQGKSYPTSCDGDGGGGGGGDPMEQEDEARKDNIPGDSSGAMRCETPDCDNKQYQLGVCRRCFAR